MKELPSWAQPVSPVVASWQQCLCGLGLGGSVSPSVQLLSGSAIVMCHGSRFHDPDDQIPTRLGKWWLDIPVEDTGGPSQPWKTEPRSGALLCRQIWKIRNKPSWGPEVTADASALAATDQSTVRSYNLREQEFLPPKIDNKSREVEAVVAGDLPNCAGVLLLGSDGPVFAATGDKFLPQRPER